MHAVEDFQCFQLLINIFDNFCWRRRYRFLLAKTLRCDSCGSFLYLYDSLKPITFHSILSCCNPFYSKPPWSYSSSPVMFHRKTSTLQSIQLFSVYFIFFMSYSDSFPTIIFHSIFSCCNPSCSNPSLLDSSPTITFHFETFILQYMQLLSAPIWFSTPITFQSIF